MAKLTITVALCTRHRSADALAVLKILRCQTITPDQYIIIENIREEQSLSPQLLRKILHHPDISYQTTVGNNLAVSRNLCLQLCHSSIIIFIDDDITFAADTLEKIVKAHLSTPKANGFATRTIHTPPSLFSTFTDYWYNSQVLFIKKPIYRPLSPTTILSLEFKTIQKYQLTFDENLNSGEDMAFFLLLQKHKFRLYYLPSIISYHQFGHRTKLVSFLKRFYHFGFDYFQKNASPAWALPTRKINYLIFPLFFLKKVFTLSNSFISDNHIQSFKTKSLCHLVFFVYFLGIYNSPTSRNFMINRLLFLAKKSFK